MISHRTIFLNHLAQTSDAPIMLEVERAEGCYMVDREGKRYLDLISGIGVSNVGHRHPKVVAAVKSQVDKYMHLMVYGEYVQSPQAKLAEKLCSLLPAPIDNVYFVNSGSEATEGAMKLAKKHTGRSKFVVMKKCYHGNTQSVMALMSDEERKAGYGPYSEDVVHLEFGNLDQLEAIDSQTAAFIIEPVMGEAGCLVHSKEYLSKARQRCNQVGALLVFDEVQCGFGRTGHFFALDDYDVVPDIVLMAKGMGGGMPIGAFAAPKSVMQGFMRNPVLGHITTFGGHPVCAAAALATIRVLEEDTWIADVREKEKIIQTLEHQHIVSLSGKGLMYAVKLKSEGMVHQVIKYCMERGIVTDWFLFAPDCIRIAPPLQIGIESLKFACSTILEALDEL